MEEKKINQMSLANCDLDEVEIVLGDRFELKIKDGKYYAVHKKSKYPKTYEEDNYCETLEIKVLGYKVGDVIFTNNAGWIKITNKLWDCYAKEHVYEGIGVLSEQEYDNIRHKDIINKMETDSVIENMKESITPSPHITANIIDKNNCDIECPDGYEFYDENGNLIGNKVMMIPKKPTYPKNYDECCDMLDADEFIGHELMREFPKLINARNAYWKIAGKQMGLDKPWEPDFSDDSPKYNIFKYENEITLSDNNWSNRILAFPTIEMRNAFYNNFRDLIEQCKELL